MTGQEARDVERKALIERAREVSGALEEYEFEGAAGEAAGLLNSLADALARKHPEPRMAGLSAAELTALLHRQSGTSSPAPLWCPRSPTRDDDTYVPHGGGGCTRCGHSTDEHEVRN